jgi:hypothetical protein
VLSFKFCGQRGKNPRNLEKNVSAIWRKLYYVMEGVPMGVKVPK